MKNLELKKLRLQAKKTQTEIADFLGITYQAYAHYEKGRREPSPEQLSKLADFYGVTVDYILGRSDFTQEERAAGAMATRKENITPLEDEMLYAFRQVGKAHGEEAQHALITIAEKMFK